MKERFLASGHQHDAHEFLTFVVEQIEKSILSDLRHQKRQKILNGNRLSFFGKNMINIDGDVISIEKMPFLGKIESVLYCNTCDSSWIKSQNIFNLSLYPPQKDGPCTVVECLNSFIKSETVNGVICRNCQCSRTVTKRLTLSKVPDILCLHFNRLTLNNDAKDNPSIIKNYSKIEFERSLNISFITNHMNNLENKFCQNYPLFIRRYFRRIMTRKNYFYSISSDAIKNATKTHEEYLSYCPSSDSDYELDCDISGTSSPSTGTTSNCSDEGDMYPCNYKTDSDNEFNSLDDIIESNLVDSFNDYDYVLKAVITHQGNHQRGHYVCYRSNSPESEDGNWVEISDSSIRSVSFKDVQSKDAFMIFYQKRGL